MIPDDQPSRVRASLTGYPHDVHPHRTPITRDEFRKRLLDSPDREHRCRLLTAAEPRRCGTCGEAGGFLWCERGCSTGRAAA